MSEIHYLELHRGCFNVRSIPSLRPVSDENKGMSVVPPHGLEIPVLLVAKINTPDPIRQPGRRWKSGEIEKKTD